MKVSWHVTPQQALEWFKCYQYAGHPDDLAMDLLMDKLSKHVQVTHEFNDPILMDMQGETDCFIVTGGLKPEHFGGLFKTGKEVE